MTHILTNPGYPNNLRFRSKSAEVFREHERRKQGISQSDFDKIRSLSRQSWKHTWENPGEPLPSVKCNHFVTTYSTTHNYRALQEPTPCRPTSPTRRNNPHPTRFVFLLFDEVFVLMYPGCQRSSRSPTVRSVRASSILSLPTRKNTSGTQGTQTVQRHNIVEKSGNISCMW